MLKKMCGACIHFDPSPDYPEYGVCMRNKYEYGGAIVREDEEIAEDCESYQQLYNDKRVRALEEKYACSIDVYRD